MNSSRDNVAAARSIYDRSQPSWQRESAPPPIMNTPAAATIQPVAATLQPLTPPSHLSPTPIMAQQSPPFQPMNTEHKVLLEWGTPEPKLDLRW